MEDILILIGSILAFIVSIPCVSFNLSITMLDKDSGEIAEDNPITKYGTKIVKFTGFNLQLLCVIYWTYIIVN